MQKETPKNSLKNGLEKSPPSAITLENQILGLCLINPTATEVAVGIFSNKKEIFYNPKNGEIWGIIFDLFTRKIPTDMIVVMQEARRKEIINTIGGDGYIIDLTTQAGATTNLQYYCRIVQEKYIARTMQQHCVGAYNSLNQESGDVFKQMDNVRTAMQEMEDMVNEQKQSLTAGEVHKLMIENYNSNIGIAMPCDFKDLKDKFMGGEAGNFILIGARPSQGKTAVGLNFATRTAMQGVPVGIFCLEMSTIEMQKRLTANICDVSFYRLTRKLLTDSEKEKLYGDGGRKIEEMPLYMDESKHITQILSKIRIMAKKGVKLVVIDYIQIISSAGMKFGTREQEIASISRSLKLLALELGIVIMALAQLSKEIDKRTVKRPISSDLRESNALENDADIIILLYRPEFYGVKEWDRAWNGVNGEPTKGEIELIFSKYRNGSPFEQRLKFWGDKMRITDIDDTSSFTNPSRTYGDDGEVKNPTVKANENFGDDFDY